LLITFIGLQSAGIVVGNPATLVAPGSLKNNAPALLALCGLILMVALEYFEIMGGLLIGIVAVTGAGIAFGLVEVPAAVVAVPPSLAPIFCQLDFSGLGSVNFWAIVFTFFFVDFFDTLGTLVGVCGRGGLLDQKGHLPNAKGALLADAVGTTVGAVLGTSTVTSYVESASGIAQGGRTGLTSLVTGLLFLVALFFSPLVNLVPTYATAPALIMVGMYMIMSLRGLDFEDWTEFFPAVLAALMMPMAYGIAIGIEFGVVAYVSIKVLTGRAKEVSWVMIALTALFAFKEIFA
jgi:AGZA family xanthine/uracil permease-like MFS transporter